MLLTNCPSVIPLASLSGGTMSATSGFTETCNIVLPIPSSANEKSIDGKE
mgnify:CR=1 FL=1